MNKLVNEKQLSKNAKLNKKDLTWFKLDNAALIYPAVSTKKWNSVYRVSVVLKDMVNVEVLNKALHDVITRFPHFNVSLNKGFFWFYFEETTVLPMVEKDEQYPCQKMEFKRKKHLFRVLYHNKKISFEAFHSLSDGYGAIVFVNSLLKRYFELSGHTIENSENTFNYLDKPSLEEVEDSFSRYADLKHKNSWSENKAYQITGTIEEQGKLNIINGIFSANDVKEFAKQYDATVNEFFLAVMFHSVLQHQSLSGYNKQPVRISMPINLRNIFPSKSLRNFSSYKNIEFSASDKTMSLQEMVNKVKENTRCIDKNYVMGNINANVKAQKNIFLRLTPLFLKNLVMKLVFFMVGERIVTISFSNVGKVKAPKEFKNFVERYEVNLGPGKINKMGSSVITFEDNMVFTFNSTIKETQMQKIFFQTLTNLGLNVKIESNIE
ncbi:MAG: hypothetical protein CVV59_00270 [Tenericutes bacterium HGW-Tenericutes-4]|nr:MAG: hypothetical protein CVV59_00270 [Tenericutes bacterium HGW-Tenericutes-4]